LPKGRETTKSFGAVLNFVAAVIHDANFMPRQAFRRTKAMAVRRQTQQAQRALRRKRLALDTIHQRAAIQRRMVTPRADSANHKQEAALRAEAVTCERSAKRSSVSGFTGFKRRSGPRARN